MDRAYPEVFIFSLDQIESRVKMKLDENLRHSIALELAEMILCANMDSSLVNDATVLLSVQDLLDSSKNLPKE